MRKYIFLLVMFVLTFCSCGEKGTTYSETDFNAEGVFGALPQMSARMSSIVKPAMDKMNEKYPKLASDDPKDKEEVVKGQEFNDYLNSISEEIVETYGKDNLESWVKEIQKMSDIKRFHIINDLGLPIENQRVSIIGADVFFNITFKFTIHLGRANEKEFMPWILFFDANGKCLYGKECVLLPNFGFQSCYVEIAVPYKTPISVLKDPDGATQKNIEFCKKMDKVTRIKIVKALDAPKFLETER